ncbi:hypothetical protein SUGI_1179310 [Cryptomeria japonica]|nr:hypothetical protein SUGI_1179310 [Cryptomeria japonica]
MEGRNNNSTIRSYPARAENSSNSNNNNDDYVIPELDIPPNDNNDNDTPQPAPLNQFHIDSSRIPSESYGRLTLLAEWLRAPPDPNDNDNDNQNENENDNPNVNGNDNLQFLLGEPTPRDEIVEKYIDVKKDECPICMEPFTKDSNDTPSPMADPSSLQLNGLKQFSDCLHVFHYNCIYKSFTRCDFRCPICRRKHSADENGESQQSDS